MTASLKLFTGQGREYELMYNYARETMTSKKKSKLEVLLSGETSTTDGRLGMFFLGKSVSEKAPVLSLDLAG